MKFKAVECRDRLLSTLAAYETETAQPLRFSGVNYRRRAAAPDLFDCALAEGDGRAPRCAQIGCITPLIGLCGLSRNQPDRSDHSRRHALIEAA